MGLVVGPRRVRLPAVLRKECEKRLNIYLLAHQEEDKMLQFINLTDSKIVSDAEGTGLITGPLKDADAWKETATGR